MCLLFIAVVVGVAVLIVACVAGAKGPNKFPPFLPNPFAPATQAILIAKST